MHKCLGSCTEGFSQKGVQPSYGRPFLEKYKENSLKLISCDFMGKHFFWTASFQCLAKTPGCTV